MKSDKMSIDTKTMKQKGRIKRDTTFNVVQSTEQKFKGIPKKDGRRQTTMWF